MAVLSAFAAAITALNVITGSNSNIKCPDELQEKINVDLNMGAGGDFIYLCYSRDQRYGDPITSLYVTSSSTSQVIVPPGYVLLNVDLNKGAKGKFIFLMYTRDKQNTPITNLDVVYGDSVPVPIPSDWRMIDQDLNEGAGGKYIFIIYQRLPAFARIRG